MTIDLSRDDETAVTKVEREREMNNAQKGQSDVQTRTNQSKDSSFILPFPPWPPRIIRL
jgi:hypothetical protein